VLADDLDDVGRITNELNGLVGDHRRTRLLTRGPR
jgi:hypothetical protein